MTLDLVLNKIVKQWGIANLGRDLPKSIHFGKYYLETLARAEKERNKAQSGRRLPNKLVSFGNFEIRRSVRNPSQNPSKKVSLGSDAAKPTFTLLNLCIASGKKQSFSKNNRIVAIKRIIPEKVIGKQ